MYIQNLITGILPGQRVEIKYDCSGGFKLCGTVANPIYKVAKKNADANDGKHICRSCQLRAKNPSSRPEVKAKVKKTVEERYAGVLPVNSVENIAARIQSMFGTEEATREIVEKRKKTSLDRYGADHIMKTDEGIRRLNESMQEKYGVDFPLQSEEVKSRMRDTCQERYGVDNPLSSPEVRVKAAKTTLAKYGVEHYNQLPEMKDYLRANCATWLADSYANPWAKGIVRPKEWNDKQRKTMIDLIISGKWQGGRWSKNHISGWCRHPAKKCRKEQPYFRSHLELIAHVHLNEDDRVLAYDFEPFSIKYEMDGVTKEYVIDFLVKYHDDDCLHFVEVKPAFKRVEAVNVAKEQAGVIYAKEVGGVFEVWDEVFLKSLGLDYKELLSREYVTRNQ